MWYIQIDRQTLDQQPMEPLVIGPWRDEEKEKAEDHLQNSLDMEDWLYAEAKASHYVADDAYLTKTPDVPSYGINPPVYY